MKARRITSAPPKRLRLQAERSLAKTPREVARMPMESVQKLVQELQVHQIELEMQNHELRRTQLQLEQARDRCADLYDFAPAAYLTLKANSEILEANLSAGNLLGLERSRLIRQKFTRFIPAEAQDTFYLLRRQVFSTDTPRSAELDLVSAKSKRLAVQLEAARDATSRRKQCRVSLIDITERKRLERQILEITDREQARLGQDLHDGLCQQLVGLAFDANALERQLARKGLPEVPIAHRIAEHLDQVTTQARELARGLFPIRLEAEGLPSALQELAGMTRERQGIECSFESHGPVELQGRVMATHLYRIAQEAVNNAIKHGRPKLITIRLNKAGETLELSVEDDGSGIAGASAQGKRSGMGFYIMNYRARSIGGTLHVTSGLANGTRVSCCLPCAGGLPLAGASRQVTFPERKRRLA